MGDTSDFTFCQTGLQVNDDRMDSREIIPAINRMTLEENNLNGGCINKIGISVQEDNLHDNERNDNSGSKGPRSSNVEDMLPSDILAKSSTGKALGEIGLLNQSQKQKSVIKKSAVRAKVPFEKGFSPMDWLKLTRTAPDLAGLKGQTNRRLISINEVKQHKSEGSVWTVLKGRVYNITPYMKFHPGGVDMLKKAAGKDCTSLFNKYHAWVNDEFLLEKCLVGFLDDSL